MHGLMRGERAKPSNLLYQTHGQIQEIGGVLFEQACLYRRQAERLSLLLLLDEWQKGLPSG